MIDQQRFQVIEGGYPGSLFDKSCQGRALGSKGPDRISDRVTGGGAACLISVGAVKCEIRLIDFTQSIAVFP